MATKEEMSSFIKELNFISKKYFFKDNSGYLIYRGAFDIVLTTYHKSTNFYIQFRKIPHGRHYGNIPAVNPSDFLHLLNSEIRSFLLFNLDLLESE